MRGGLGFYFTELFVSLRTYRAFGSRSLMEVQRFVFMPLSHTNIPLSKGSAFSVWRGEVADNNLEVYKIES